MSSLLYFKDNFGPILIRGDKMKKKIQGLIFLSVALVIGLVLLVGNIKSLTNEKNSNISGNTVNAEDSFFGSVDKEDDSDLNVPIYEVEEGITEYRDSLYENGKHITEVYKLDIKNFNVLKSEYGMSEESLKRAYDLVTLEILRQYRKSDVLEIDVNSIEEKNEGAKSFSFICRNMNTKQKLFKVTFDFEYHVEVTKIS